MEKKNRAIELRSGPAMEPYTTIPRNATRKIAAIKEQNPTVKLHDLRNDFAGSAVDARHAWEELARYDFARLIYNTPGHWTIRIHSNRWFELRATP